MQKRRVLVVDDEKDFCQLVKTNLEETGEFEVRTVTASKEALEAALSFKPEVMLLDIFMPEMDGGDVAYQIKFHPELKGTTIIFLTAVATQEDIEASDDGYIGGHPFIAKPVSTAQLVEGIKRYSVKC